jgi:hypothetical protein
MSIAIAICATDRTSRQMVGGVMLEVSPGMPTMLTGYGPHVVNATSVPYDAATATHSVRRMSRAR